MPTRWLQWMLGILMAAFLVGAPFIYYRIRYDHAKRLRVVRPGIPYHRILASLPPDVAELYGHASGDTSDVEQQIGQAIASKNWRLASELSAKLANQTGQSH